MSRRCGACVLKALTFVSLALGLAFLAAVWIGPGLVREALNRKVRENVVLTPTSPDAVYDRFTRNDRPPTNGTVDLVNFYLWNITNVAEVRAGARPALEQLGPYVYRKWRVRRNVQFDRKGLVSFVDTAWVTSYHAPDVAAAGRNASVDVVTTLNLPLLGVLRAIEYVLNGTIKTLAEITLAEIFRDSGPREGLFMRRTAAQLLFGYEDELLATLARVVPSLKAKARFQLVDNSTDEDAVAAQPRTVMDSGLRDISKVWDFRKWKGLDEITCWNNYSERIRGSDAQQFPPGLQPNSSVHVFVGELFRVAKLNVTGEVDAFGVKLLKYQPDSKQGDPDTRHFQEIQGLMNVSACMAVGPDGDPSSNVGPDILMSFPHFCYVDSSVAQQTIGTKCNHGEHDLWLGIEPTTGITMKAAKRLQVSSTFDNRYPAFDAHVRPTILPIFWAEELVTIGRADAENFKAGMYTAFAIIAALRSWWMLAVALSLLLTSVALFALGVYGKHRQKPAAPSSPASLNGVNCAGVDADDAVAHVDAADSVAIADEAMTQPLLPQPHDERVEIRDEAAANGDALLCHSYRVSSIDDSDEQGLGSGPTSPSGNSQERHAIP